jgi:UDP-glucose 4-epimerase
VREAARGCALILHLAAVASVARSLDAPEETRTVNVDGTENVLVAAREAGARRVVVASTCAVYGDPDELPVDEWTALDPQSPYAASKATVERLCLSLCDRGGLDIGPLRFFNVYGPRQDPSSDYSGVIAVFMDHLAAGTPCTLYGDGGQTRDFVYVSDVIEACRLAFDARRLGAQPLNVGTGVETSVRELLAMLMQGTGRESEVVAAPARQGEVRHSRASRNRAADQIGWEPEVRIVDGLAATWAWYRTRREAGADEEAVDGAGAEDEAEAAETDAPAEGETPQATPEGATLDAAAGRGPDAATAAPDPDIEPAADPDIEPAPDL